MSLIITMMISVNNYNIINQSGQIYTVPLEANQRHFKVQQR